MAKVAVVYWSGTGNTERMAEAIVDGIKGAGAEVELFEVDSFSADNIADYDALAMGCSAMGDEVLEEGSFQPFFDAAKEKISGKPVILFGSYGWGGGAWMRVWEQETKDAGAKLIGNGLDFENDPDDEAINAGKKLASELVAAI